MFIWDHRSMSFEPVKQDAWYHRSGDIAYQIVIKDSCTDFFIAYLPMGTHVIEYDVVITYNGDISAGFAEIQSISMHRK